MLKALNIHKSYRTKKVLTGISIFLDRSEIVGLLGANGAGKTTLFKIIAGFINMDEGEIYLDGKNIMGAPVWERAMMGITYLSQEPSVFRGMNVEDNIVSVLEYRGYSKREAKKRALHFLEIFGLRGKEKEYAWALSGGEKRRLEVARALSVNPSFILMDEPFTGIDPLMIQDLKEMIKIMNSKSVGVLISDHNVRDTLSICTRAYIINNGRIIAHGSPEEIVKNEEVKKYYLGEMFRL